MSKLNKSKVLFCIAALMSFFFSVYLWFSGQKQDGVFVGLWVPSILSLGALLIAGRSTKS
jgi:glycerol-3-phosphate acyltransferase PlsY